MNTVKLISFGRGGHREESENSTLSGYDSPDRWKPDADSDYSDCITLDVRDAVLLPAGYRWAIAGPMLNVSLADGERDRCPVPSPMLAAGLEGSFKTLAALQPFGSLDGVSRSEYVDGWRQHGARVGRVTDSGIDWEPIPAVPVQQTLFAEVTP